MVGATGSGKSTTLASMIDHRNEQRAGHILTSRTRSNSCSRTRSRWSTSARSARDTQTLQIALKNALRQAPDVHPDRRDPRPRDDDARRIAYAQSGHLCLATLHANNSYHALNRIISFYPLGGAPGAAGRPGGGPAGRSSRSAWCARVAGGRMPAVEVLLNTKLIAELIEQGRLLRRQGSDGEVACAEGSQTFEQDIARLIIDGIDHPRRRPGLRRLADQPDVAAAERHGAGIADRAEAEEHATSRASPRSTIDVRRTSQRSTSSDGSTDLRADPRARCPRRSHLAEQLIARRSVTPDDGGCQAHARRAAGAARLRLRDHRQRPGRLPRHQPVGMRRGATPAGTLLCLRRPHRRRADRPARAVDAAIRSCRRTATASCTAAAPPT